jgi:hypothetical protein
MRMLRPVAIALATLLTAANGSISILFDYTYDDGFFSGDNSSRRTLLEAAADVFMSRLKNATLDPIVPSGSNHWTLELSNPTTDNLLQIHDPTLVADTLTIYVGAHDLPDTTLAVTSSPGWSATGDDSWLELIQSKNSPTRFEPLGASIAFDDAVTWYFDPNPLTLESFTGKYDFFSVAQHEIGHALGFSSGANAFAANTADGAFAGAHASSLYGGPIPLSADASHWANNVIFQGDHLNMDPTLPMNTRTFFGPLEFAVLKDIGYNTPSVLGTLHVSVDDTLHGSVTANLLGDTKQEVGRQLAIRAIPRHGYLFAGWTGDVISTANPLYFVMAEEMTLQATFVLSPFIECKGRFYGIFESSAPETNGTWQLKVNAYGQFTGTFITDGKRRPVVGALDATGHWSKIFPDGVRVELTQDLETGRIQGTLEVVQSIAPFAGDKLPVFSQNNRAQAVGAYTLVMHLDGDNAEGEVPRGPGCATLRVTPTGMARLIGKLSDGVDISASVPLTVQNEIALSRRFSDDYLHGRLAFPSDTAATDLEGRLGWSRSPRDADSAATVAWPNGFSTTLAITASRWIKPSRGVRVLSAMDANNGVAHVVFDTAFGLVESTIVLDQRNVAIENPPTMHAVKITTAATTGAFRGSFVDMRLAKHSFRGVFLQRQMRGDGFFVDGAVAVLPAP